MYQYILRRLLQAIPVLLGVTFVTYFLVFYAGGDPARLAMGVRSDLATVESFKEEWGLDKPWHVQYLTFLKKLSHGDLGRSLSTNEEVLLSILERFPATFKLGMASLAFAIILGIPIGIISAVKPRSFLDNALMVVALLGISTPSFFFGVILVWVFGYLLRWLPVSGFDTGLAGFQYLILPAIALGTGPLAIFARLTRSSMLEVMRQEYILTARAKGLDESRVILKHALKNSLISVVTVIGSSLAGLLSGTFFVEFIFGWPGIGLLAVDAISNFDIPLILGIVIFESILFVLANIAVDITYAFLDPRIHYE